MQFHSDDIEQAFRVLVNLIQRGKVTEDEEVFHYYLTSSEVRSLIDSFAAETDSVIIKTSEHLFLLPKSGQSIFHVKNAYIRREYFGYQSTNLDIYMMYFCIIVLFGAFYDSYETSEATRDFLPLGEWLAQIRERLDTLKEHGPEKLAELEQESELNWSGVIEYWEALDDLKETAKRQDSKQQSRLGFLKRVIRFLKDQDLVLEQGNDELVLTEKAKIIIQRYFMDLEYNRGILAFMYQYDQVKGNE